MTTYWAFAAALAERLLAVAVSSHAVLTRRDSRSSIGWVGLIWLAPFLGSLAYFALGINRLRRRGGQLQKELEQVLSQVRPGIPQHSRQLLDAVKLQYPQFGQMHDLVESLTDSPLLPRNSVEPLAGGEAAYAAMIKAIDEAKSSISLETYIFDNDRTGRRFIDALKAAQLRGVDVRILVDAVGARYSRPTAVSVMRREGLNCQTFLPTHLPTMTFYSNLRNHRKLLIVDGTISFTGGMNIRDGLCTQSRPEHPVQDIHFRFQGPVSLHLQEAFATDWCFAAREILKGDRWFPKVYSTGDVSTSVSAPVWCRGIPDGPDEDFEKLKMTILGALSIAQKSILIVTPYFLPDESIVAALGVAALRGVSVCILIPEVSNIRLVQWATMPYLPELLEYGCEIFFTPPPFDHSKLFLVDDDWSLIGSTNWDPRSLRLNFEFNVECYGTQLSSALKAIITEKRSRARRVTLEELQKRHLLLRLRDGVARLGSPYL